MRIRSGVWGPSAALAAALLASATPVRAQASEAVARARALYAAAAYDEALRAIDASGDSEGTTWSARRDLAETKLLCLVALGRTADAREAMTQLVDLDPLFTLPEGSPSVRSTFLAVRAARLPSVVRGRLAAAREAFARGDYLRAQADFTVVRDLAADPALEASDLAPMVRDVRMIAEGYLELSVHLWSESGSAVSEADAAVQAPVPIEEHMPPWLPGHVRPSRPYEARVEIVIGRSGQVESARILESSDPKYDVYILNAARNWRYTPAFHDGVAVAFKRVVPVVVAPQ